MDYATTTRSQYIQGASAVQVLHLNILLETTVKVGCKCSSKSITEPDRRAAMHPFYHGRKRYRDNSDPRRRYIYMPDHSMYFCLYQRVHRCSIARQNKLAASSRTFLKVWMQGPSTSFQAVHLQHPGILHRHLYPRMTYTGLWRNDWNTC